MEKIDYVAMREDVRRQYANWPTNGDELFEFESRAAEVVADLCVFIVKEAAERDTPPDIMLQGLAAIMSVPAENLISNVPLDRMETAGRVANYFIGYILDATTSIADRVEIKRRDVGDA